MDRSDFLRLILWLRKNVKNVWTEVTFEKQYWHLVYRSDAFISWKTEVIFRYFLMARSHIFPWNKTDSFRRIFMNRITTPHSLSPPPLLPVIPPLSASPA